MGTRQALWDFTNKCFVAGLIGVTVSDRFYSVIPIRGASMSPTFNPQRNSFLDDYVLVEKLCLTNYKFSHGDVVIFRSIFKSDELLKSDVAVAAISGSSPSNFREKHVKRIIGLPGEWIGTSHDVVKIPEGHCWVQGDNSASSFDSRSFGPIPLGLIQGRATHIVWPPHRLSKVDNKSP